MESNIIEWNRILSNGIEKNWIQQQEWKWSDFGGSGKSRLRLHLDPILTKCQYYLSEPLLCNKSRRRSCESCIHRTYMLATALGATKTRLQVYLAIGEKEANSASFLFIIGAEEGGPRRRDGDSEINFSNGV